MMSGSEAAAELLVYTLLPVCVAFYLPFVFPDNAFWTRSLANTIMSVLDAVPPEDPTFRVIQYWLFVLSPMLTDLCTFCLIILCSVEKKPPQLFAFIRLLNYTEKHYYYVALFAHAVVRRGKNASLSSESASLFHHQVFSFRTS